MNRKQLMEKIVAIEKHNFEEVALEICQYQYEYNAIYKEFIDYLKINPKKIVAFENIPFLPIQFFKKYLIQSGNWKAKTTFSSSGTTGQITSQHLVRTEKWYLENAAKGFAQHYGAVENYCVLALLPSYLEREGSSLVLMAEDFIRRSKFPQSGFYLYEYDKLIAQLIENQANKIPTLLLGVSFALLDLAEKQAIDLSENTIVMETGGMKGKRKEMTRADLHAIFSKKFNVPMIHSEYGMTELFSQGYSKGDGVFFPINTMRVLTRSITDPFENQSFGKNGIIHVVDLANIDTCSFIATEDIGVVFSDKSFEIKGRLDASEMRGCNLMVE